MPRKPSDKIITHRIEFSPTERNLLSEMQQQNKINNMFKRVQTGGNTFAGLAVPVGIGVAAVAFWRWAGGGAILEELKEGFMNWSEKLGKAMDDNLFNGTFQDWLGVKDAEGAIEAMKELEAKCKALIEEQNKILSSPFSTENQKAQAQEKIRQITKACEQEKKRLNGILKEFQAKADFISDVPNPAFGPVGWLIQGILK